MAFARILKNERITNMIRIKYKNPYRVFLLFNEKDQADRLLSCETLSKMEIRAQFTNEKSMSYGIIKGVDLDFSEEELLKNLDSTSEIISAKRLNRKNELGKWVQSETIRICFKNNSTPQYVYAYGCRFEVEKYVFPVTQCSNCWKFGHSKKFCAHTKITCPKCGQDHTNCETERFVCPNCKGPHMALNKMCPYFIKEKKLRDIMSKQDVSYKKALEIFLQKAKETQENESILNNIIEERITDITCNIQPSYRDILVTSEVHESNQSNEKTMSNKSQTEKVSKQKKKKTKKVSRKKTNEQSEDNNIMDYQNDTTDEETSSKEDIEKKRERKIDIWNLLLKIRNIICSQEKIEDKVTLVLKAVYEEIATYIKKFVKGKTLAEFFIKQFNG